MTPEQLIVAIVLAGLMGAIGQGTRVIVGLKKASDQASATNASLVDVFETSRLVVSLLLGFIAGVLALLALGPAELTGTEPKTQILLGLMAAGYAGADFIEGFARKYLPGQDQTLRDSPSGQLGGPAMDRPRAALPDTEVDAETNLPSAIG